MFFQILEVVLWPKNTSLMPRRVKFHLGKVNVISGSSKSGKTAVIPIIDYCLGAQQCRIPVGTIRKHCEWFGVIVETSEGKKLLARKEPGRNKQSGAMFILEDEFMVPPDVISRKNATTDDAKMILNRLACLTSFDFSSEVNSGYNSRPSFRDLVVFNFQPQNIVANPDVLFFKADTTRHREKLKTLFPYLLGAITLDILEDKKLLESLKRELKQKEGEIKLAEVGVQRLKSELQAWFSSAKAMGLIRYDKPYPEGFSDAVSVLTQLLSKDSLTIVPTAEAITSYSEEIYKLSEQEKLLSTELFQLRERYAQLDELRVAYKDYQNALKIQRDRLNLSVWLRERCFEVREEGVGRIFADQNDYLDSLCNSLESIESRISLFHENADVHSAEYLELKELIKHKTTNLADVKKKQKFLIGKSNELKKQASYQVKVDRFLGALGNALETYRRAALSNPCRKQISELSKKICKIDLRIKQTNVKAREKQALSRVIGKASQIVPQLDSEWPDTPFSLDIKDLTVRVQHEDREDALWEIGSGANWLAYHVAITLGLQQFFLKHNASVPNFLIYDQPSQVYFPRRLAGEVEESDPEFSDEDVVAVKKIFKALGVAVLEADAKLQVIVLDHATEEVWGDVDGVQAVEEWRGGKKLIPQSWLGNS